MRFDNELEQEIQQLVEQAKQTNLTNKSTVQSIDIQIEDLQKQIENLIETKKCLKNKVANLISQIKKLLPKEFYSCQINKTWDKPLHYKVKSFIYDYDDDTIEVNIQEIRKKKPWENWNGDYTISFEQFKEYSVCDTYEKASIVYEEHLEQLKQRPCPQCGKIIGDVYLPWCRKCIDKFFQEYENSIVRYYDPQDNTRYEIHPEVISGYSIDHHPLRSVVDRWKFTRGYNGKRFRLHRLDTDEIIETRNLWEYSADEEDKLLPHIRIFETEEYQCGERKWIKYMYREDRIKAEQERKKKLREETKADPQLSWMLDFE